MITYLRNLADGCRFILLRTGKRYVLVGREKRANRTVLVIRESGGMSRISTLNHQYLVIPLVKLRVKFKQKS